MPFRTLIWRRGMGGKGDELRLFAPVPCCWTDLALITNLSLLYFVTPPLVSAAPVSSPASPTPHSNSLSGAPIPKLARSHSLSSPLSGRATCEKGEGEGEGPRRLYELINCGWGAKRF